VVVLLVVLLVVVLVVVVVQQLLALLLLVVVLMAHCLQQLMLWSRTLPTQRHQQQQIHQMCPPVLPLLQLQNCRRLLCPLVKLQWQHQQWWQRQWQKLWGWQ
jgi:hypothetical protein